MTARRLVILGPTASGKSDVAMAVAVAAAARGIGQREIVAVDSMQVYRGMDIGTAKPSTADQAAVRHHGIDLVDAGTDFTVADFQRAATTALDDIAGRGATALLVAGTGLYLTSILDGLTLPGEWPQLRAELERDANPTELHARLAVLDPAAAARIEPGNTRRVVRALEVCLGSGRSFSSFGPGTGAYPPIETVQIGLRWPRPLLAARVERRVHAMVAAGLVDEVTRLVSAPGGMSRTARQALGYKEVIAHLDGECSLESAVADIVVRTRQFAVRQERWFRRDPRVRWIDITDDPVATVAPVVEEHLA